jgi:hypothetical protein
VQFLPPVVGAPGLLLFAWQSYLPGQQVNAKAVQLRLTQETMRATLDGQLFARVDAISSLHVQDNELYAGL